MEETLRHQVARAVQDGLEARAAFYAAMAEPDKQHLGAPCSQEQIAEVERHLKKPLPPSYRAFLELHDGWEMFDAATDLLSTGSIVKEAASPRLASWRKIATEVEGIDVSSWLLIGASKVGASKYFLDPTRVEADGEMVVIDHDKVIEEEYASFLEFLVKSNEQYRNGLSDMDGGFDFSKI